MNLFNLTVWIAATIPIAGHLYGLWTLRSTPRSTRIRSARIGLLLGLLIVALNLLQLMANSVPGVDARLVLIAAPIAALLIAFIAIPLMRHSGDLEVQSIGIPAIILSLFSVATVVTLGSLTIAG